MDPLTGRPAGAPAPPPSEDPAAARQNLNQPVNIILNTTAIDSQGVRRFMRDGAVPELINILNNGGAARSRMNEALGRR